MSDYTEGVEIVRQRRAEAHPADEARLVEVIANLMEQDTRRAYMKGWNDAMGAMRDRNRAAARALLRREVEPPITQEEHEQAMAEDRWEVGEQLRREIVADTEADERLSAAKDAAGYDHD